jgi:hypothetical protein
VPVPSSVTMTVTTGLVLSTAVSTTTTATSSSAVASTTAIAAAAVAGATASSTTPIPAGPVAGAPVSSSASTISTVIASISPAISATRIATTFSSAATGTRGSDGDAVGCDGSVPGRREDQHVRPAPTANLQIIELGSAIVVRDSRGGSGQSTAAGRDRCRHWDAAGSKLLTVGVLYLDCRLAVQPDTGCS